MKILTPKPNKPAEGIAQEEIMVGTYPIRNVMIGRRSYVAAKDLYNLAEQKDGHKYTGRYCKPEDIRHAYLPDRFDRIQNMTVINTSGVVRLINRAGKRSAEEKKNLIHVVIPQMWNRETEWRNSGMIKNHTWTNLWLQFSHWLVRVFSAFGLSREISN